MLRGSYGKKGCGSEFLGKSEENKLLKGKSSKRDEGGVL